MFILTSPDPKITPLVCVANALQIDLLQDYRKAQFHYFTHWTAGINNVLASIPISICKMQRLEPLFVSDSIELLESLRPEPAKPTYAIPLICVSNKDIYTIFCYQKGMLHLIINNTVILLDWEAFIHTYKPSYIYLFLDNTNIPLNMPIPEGNPYLKF